MVVGESGNDKGIHNEDGAGKTCLLMTYNNGKFPHTLKVPTVLMHDPVRTVTVSYSRWSSSLS